MKATPKVIQKMRAFIFVDDDGNEGIIAHWGLMGWQPLVCGYEEKFAKNEEKAREMATATGKPVHIIEFTTRTQIGIIQP